MNRSLLSVLLPAAMAPFAVSLSSSVMAEEVSEKVAEEAPVDSVDLPTVTVTADFRQTDVQQIPEATTVVTGAEIEARSAEHLEQVLSFALTVADRMLVIDKGKIVHEAVGEQIDKDHISRYLSV